MIRNCTRMRQAHTRPRFRRATLYLDVLPVPRLLVGRRLANRRLLPYVPTASNRDGLVRRGSIKRPSYSRAQRVGQRRPTETVSFEEAPSRGRGPCHPRPGNGRWRRHWGRTTASTCQALQPRAVRATPLGTVRGIWADGPILSPCRHHSAVMP